MDRRGKREERDGRARARACGRFIFHLGQGYVLLRRTPFVFVEYGEGRGGPKGFDPDMEAIYLSRSQVQKVNSVLWR